MWPIVGRAATAPWTYAPVVTDGEVRDGGRIAELVTAGVAIGVVFIELRVLLSIEGRPDGVSAQCSRQEREVEGRAITRVPPNAWLCDLFYCFYNITFFLFKAFTIRFSDKYFVVS